ncbi:hypothetical protein PV327_004604 [Microctonus hyperodae]|uniref:NADH dehydrogenase [ubiquinone] 1 alpha subcomplex subunit 12 n=1 Tax=Microctonus hyperodae TaxID=165561 RepID=A0AA39KMU6_MICHY|nr:hypothetical protein PV327_004604 [Microctonus hyperodae]
MNPVKIIKGYIDIFGRLGQIYRQHGGLINVIKTSYRTDDLKLGTHVGTDKYGNRYFQNNFYFYGRNRWVIYADRVNDWYDGSQVPAEWFGWLHYKTDLLPHQDPSRPKYEWMTDHRQNLSGTKEAYVPYSTTKPKIEPWKPS